MVEGTLTCLNSCSLIPIICFKFEEIKVTFLSTVFSIHLYVTFNHVFLSFQNESQMNTPNVYYDTL